MQPPPAAVLVVVAVVMAGLLALHLVATRGTGELKDPQKQAVSVSPRTTLSLWYHHLWAGFFHHTWGHLAYNLAVLAVAFPFAARSLPPLATLAHAYWIGPFVVFTLHLLLVLPLAKLGVGYAVGALDYRLVGFSVMAYSIAGAAFTQAPPRVAAWAALGLVVYEVALAFFATGPFIFAYHLGGFALGYWVRRLLVGPLAA